MCLRRLVVGAAEGVLEYHAFKFPENGWRIFQMLCQGPFERRHVSNSAARGLNLLLHRFEVLIDYVSDGGLVFRNIKISFFLRTVSFEHLLVEKVVFDFTPQ